MTAQRLDDLTWQRPEAGSWVGRIKRADGLEYEVVLHYRQFDETWEMLCTVSGRIAHRSEHESRGEAAAEAAVVLARAIDIRERTEP